MRRPCVAESSSRSPTTSQVGSRALTAATSASVARAKPPAPMTSSGFTERDLRRLVDRCALVYEARGADAADHTESPGGDERRIIGRVQVHEAHGAGSAVERLHDVRADALER